MRVVIRKAHHP